MAKKETLAPQKIDTDMAYTDEARGEIDRDRGENIPQEHTAHRDAHMKHMGKIQEKSEY